MIKRNKIDLPFKTHIVNKYLINVEYVTSQAIAPRSYGNTEWWRELLNDKRKGVTRGCQSATVQTMMILLVRCSHG
jgi:hypothetical protein